MAHDKVDATHHQTHPDRGGAGTPLLQAKTLTKHFPLGGGAVVRAVDGVDFAVMKGETLGVVGESGCGTSTTARVVMQLIPQDKGEMLFDGEIVGGQALTLKEYRRQAQMVFQDSYASLNPRLTIEDSIAFGPTVHGVSKANAILKARDLLQRVGLDPARFAHMMGTNSMGVVNCVAALAPGMMARGSGHLSWIASVAGYVGLPKAAAYGPTKAALINLAESLEPEMGLKGVAVSVINPGFVETPLTAQNDFPMPFLMKADDAARRTIAGLAAGKFEIAYPRRFVAILKALRLLPYPLFFRLIRRAVLKNG
jgi:predicted ABC-type transport system involved in lysophospholipase L1 biosynthesis ATPase subunit